jgi:hypothetical protein
LRENHRWGHLRIVGEPRKLAITVSTTLVRNVPALRVCRRRRGARG